MQRLLPQPTQETSVDEALDELRPWHDPPSGRPRLLSNFVQTLDGRIAVEGSSRASEATFDTAMLVGLRLRVDAVMIGAGTLRAERYGRVVPDPAKREQRRGARARRGSADGPGQRSHAAALGRGPVHRGPGEVVIFTSSEAEPPETATSVEVVRHERRIDLVEAMRHLRKQRGIRAVLCEGGPHLHGDLIEDGLVDEMFVTQSPKLVGGQGPSLVGGLLPNERPLEIDVAAARAEHGRAVRALRTAPL